MPTSSLAGDRSRRARNPRDITGRRYAELQAEADARKSAATADIREVQRRSREAGYSDGWDAAIGWVIERMTDAGLDPDILVANGDEPGENE